MFTDLCGDHGVPSTIPQTLASDETHVDTCSSTSQWPFLDFNNENPSNAACDTSFSLDFESRNDSGCALFDA